MSTTQDYMKFISEQLSGGGEITYRKMFGEYGLYCNGKIFALVCADQLFIKITEAGRRLAPDLKTAPPYDGAKPYFLMEDIDDRKFLTDFVTATCEELPPPKPKKTRKVGG